MDTVRQSYLLFLQVALFLSRDAWETTCIICWQLNRSYFLNQSFQNTLVMHVSSRESQHLASTKINLASLRRHNILEMLCIYVMGPWRTFWQWFLSSLYVNQIFFCRRTYRRTYRRIESRVAPQNRAHTPVKVKPVDLYSALDDNYLVLKTWITQFNLQTTPSLPLAFVRVHQMALPRICGDNI